tara:strand:+ start:3513 stop:3986 length:474 start_codon:yes stop_codon:yes gene_type:complete
MKNYVKTILIIFFINFIEFRISSLLSNFYIVLPLTFLFYSYYVYQSIENISPLEAFLLGLFVDLISNSFFGLNAILFCLITYLINLYSNSFKLFSYLQICVFFGLSAASYVGFSQLIINLYNFSYLTLLISTIFNIFFTIILAIASIYLRSFFKFRK